MLEEATATKYREREKKRVGRGRGRMGVGRGRRSMQVSSVQRRGLFQRFQTELCLSIVSQVPKPLI